MPANPVELDDAGSDGNARNHADKDSKAQGLHLPIANLLRIIRDTDAFLQVWQVDGARQRADEVTDRSQRAG
jgi:hypothetical protein